MEDHILPARIREITGQTSVPFGVAVVAALDATLASETCEEMFTPNSPNITYGLNGVDIIGNGSGSHHQLRKLNARLELIRGATSKGGGVYTYSNQQGCDGGRLYFDGCALVCVNGDVVAQGSQFSLRDVEVVLAVVDLNDVRSYRSAMASRQVQAQTAKPVPKVTVDFSLRPPSAAAALALEPSPARAISYHVPEEEIALGPACWLWDYLRRSGAGGFFLPLSGGADSASVAAIVGIMAGLVVECVKAGDAQVLCDARRVVGEDPATSAYAPTDSREFASRVLHTCYMGTVNSSSATRQCAADVAEQIGSYHLTVFIDEMVAAILATFVLLTGKTPRFSSRGGSPTEDLALQHIQARLRMVFAYLLAQLLLWVRGRRGWLLVLGTANVDEGLRGYMTKYDCSSADINPIGAISKLDLRNFLLWAAKNRGWAALEQIVHAVPTAELRPIEGDAAGATAGAQPVGISDDAKTDWTGADITSSATTAATTAAAPATVAPAHAAAGSAVHSQSDEVSPALVHSTIPTARRTMVAKNADPASLVLVLNAWLSSSCVMCYLRACRRTWG